MARGVLLRAVWLNRVSGMDPIESEYRRTGSFCIHAYMNYTQRINIDSGTGSLFVPNDRTYEPDDSSDSFDDRGRPHKTSTTEEGENVWNE